MRGPRAGAEQNECDAGGVSRQDAPPMPRDAAPAPGPPLAPIHPRLLILLGAAAFCAAATMRAIDPLLAQIAEEFRVSIGAAGIVATVFTLAYGLFQVVYGGLGDRIGKVTVIAGAALLCGVFTILGALAGSIAALAALRLLSGATAGAMIPMAMAHIGDVVPYDQRQPVLARFISGQIIGMLAGQALGGILGEHIGWRGVFVLFGLCFVALSALLWADLRAGRVAQTTAPTANALRQLVSLLRVAKVRLLLGTVFVEGMLFFGAFTYVGACLRTVHGLGYDALGLVLACFALGGLAYTTSARRFVAKLGQRGMVRAGGGLLAAAFLAMALLPPWWAFGPLAAACGMGFYLLHNTMQTHATQMAPHARGAGVAFFAAFLFLGQSAGIGLAGWTIDAAGFRPVFAAAGICLGLLALVFAARLARTERTAAAAQRAAG